MLSFIKALPCNNHAAIIHRFSPIQSAVKVNVLVSYASAFLLLDGLFISACWSYYQRAEGVNGDTSMLVNVS